MGGSMAGWWVVDGCGIKHKWARPVDSWQQEGAHTMTAKLPRALQQLASDPQPAPHPSVIS